VNTADAIDDLENQPTGKAEGFAETLPDGTGRLETGKIPVELTDDFSPLLTFFGFSPDEFEVIDDTVKVAKWQQSKRLESGDRDTIWLYSYKARFRRRSPAQILADEELDRMAALVRAPRRTLGAGLGPGVTYVHHQGDEQAGKGAGGGLDGLLTREQDAVERSLDAIKRLRKAGHNIEAIADVSAGDRVENIFGHYPSQARTTATLRKQMGFAVDMDCARLEAFAAFGLPIIAPRTPSNHGEIRQVIGQAPYTSASDNLDLTLAELSKRVLDRTKIADQIDWQIPHDEWMTTFELSGVPVGLTHGHKVQGKIADWTRKQRDYFHFHHQTRLSIIMMGHHHHAQIEDVGGTWLIVTTSLDGGSEWFEASQGQRSLHGALGYLVGSSLRSGWDCITFL
jgi:hypothetical protein